MARIPGRNLAASSGGMVELPRPYASWPRLRYVTVGADPTMTMMVARATGALSQNYDGNAGGIRSGSKADVSDPKLRAGICVSSGVLRMLFFFCWERNH